MDTFQFSNAVCKVNYRELEHYLMITRRYAINVDIERDCPGSMRHSPGLLQQNLPSQHENDVRGLSRHIFQKKIFRKKFELRRYISENFENSHV